MKRGIVLPRRGFINLAAGAVARLWPLSGVSLLPRAGANPKKSKLPPVSIDEVVLEDFDDVVTASDFGFNDFSGNVGTINKNGVLYGNRSLACSTPMSCALRFEWDFTVPPNDPEAFTGLFFSLFGLSDTQATFDGETVQTIFFPEHSLNLDRIDGPVVEPEGPRSLQNLNLALTYTGVEDVTLRLELSDAEGGGRFQRFLIEGSPGEQALRWDFRTDFQVIGAKDLDLAKAKIFALVIERLNVADGVENPDSGVLSIHRIWFAPDRPEIEPSSDEALLDLLERRAFQYFVDWSSRKPESMGFPQDRSTFGDLLTVGGVGFALPALMIGAERGWISREYAVDQVLPVLRVLGDPAAHGPERVGRAGHRGWFYHFLGVDGRRKVNFDFADTPQREDLNTVELSTIDTGLALMGVLATQSYFNRTNEAESEIRGLAQAIYDRVQWGFMLEATSGQFYLSWKPKEERDGPPYEIPDAFGEGEYSGTLTPVRPFTLDFYTDEALIVSLLALGSKTQEVPPGVYCAWERVREAGLIKSFPGSLFTYQFFRAFIDTRIFKSRVCPELPAENWYQNSQKAIRTVIKYAEKNPAGLPTYGADAWGISACERPDDRYRAYGARPVAINEAPEEDGTVTYYGMLSSASFGSDLRARAIQALRHAWVRGHWHPRFGLPDAFHDEIRNVIAANPNGPFLRTEGPWVQRALFAIDQGPMLLHLENQRSGLIWRLLEANNNIQVALKRLEDLG